MPHEQVEALLEAVAEIRLVLAAQAQEAAVAYKDGEKIGVYPARPATNCIGSAEWFCSTGEPYLCQVGVHYGKGIAKIVESATKIHAYKAGLLKIDGEAPRWTVDELVALKDDLKAERGVFAFDADSSERLETWIAMMELTKFLGETDIEHFAETSDPALLNAFTDRFVPKDQEPVVPDVVRFEEVPCDNFDHLLDTFERVGQLAQEHGLSLRGC